MVDEQILIKKADAILELESKRLKRKITEEERNSFIKHLKDGTEMAVIKC